jgi:hypothetical protein
MKRALLLAAAMLAAARFVAQPVWAHEQEAPQEVPEAPQEVHVEEFSVRIANTAGQGASVRHAAGPQAPRAGVLREGTTVLLTGNEQTIAEQSWLEIDSEDHRVKGWVWDGFLEVVQTAP